MTSTSDMACSICKNVIVAPLTQELESSDVQSVATQWISLQKSALQGCMSCSFLCSTVLAGIPSQSLIKGVDVWFEKSFLCVGVNYVERGSSIGVLEILFPFAEKATSWPAIPVGTFGSFEPVTPASAAKQIQDWLEVCDSEHVCDESGLTTVRRLPTRVIDVGDSDHEPRLHVTGSGERARYAALSHCWGSSSSAVKRLKSTSHNFEQLRKGIANSTLPDTFRDAIIMCRRLAIRYLWIDSLCILQDSEADWHIESGRMKDIYQNAYLTFAADLAPNSDSGLFQTSVLIKSRDYTQRDANGTMHNFRVRRNWPAPGKLISEDYDSKSCYASETTSCLDSRAWVLQERLLSSRTVHFTSSELRWECRAAYECSCGIPVEQRSPKRAFDRALSHARRPRSSAQETLSQSARLWQTVVRDFSIRRLSYPTDRLPAISGIAEEMPLPASDYRAGLWQPSILLDLLWYNPFGHETWKEIAGDRTRATTYSSEYPSGRSEDSCAPTWSWTSITGPVQYGSLSNREVRLECELSQVFCVPDTANPFGPVKPGASVHIKGCLVPVTIEERRSPVLDEDKPDTIIHTSIEMCIEREDMKFQGRNKTWFDVDPDTCEWKCKADKYFILVIATEISNNKPLALILKERDDLTAGLLGDASQASERRTKATTTPSAFQQVKKRTYVDMVGETACAPQDSLPSVKAQEPRSASMKRPRTDDDVGNECLDELHSSQIVSSTASAGDTDVDHLIFSRIGLVRLDNWSTCEWRAEGQMRTVKLV